jgi:hypothetical protein
MAEVDRLARAVPADSVKAPAPSKYQSFRSRSQHSGLSAKPIYRLGVMPEGIYLLNCAIGPFSFDRPFLAVSYPG